MAQACWHSCPHCGADYSHAVPDSADLDKYFAPCARCARTIVGKPRPAANAVEQVIEQELETQADAAHDAQLIAHLADTWEREPAELDECEFAFAARSHDA